MKVIQTVWSKPAFHNQQEYANSRKFGGWLSFKYFLLSSTLSCLTLKRHHEKVELYTDTFGYDLYVNQLKLPYTDVYTTLDSLHNADHRLWILGKLKTIALQRNPFIHVDNDIFVWKKFPVSTKKDFIIAQSQSLTPNIYLNTLSEIYENFSYIPKCLVAWQTMANVGIIGGNNIDFFQEFSEISKNILEKNKSNIDNVNVGYLNQIVEEYLFVCLARYKSIPIKFLIKIPLNTDPIEKITRFHLTPLIDKYIHLIGEMKQNIFACEQIEVRLKYEFPDFYKLVMDLLTSLYPSSVHSSSLLKVTRLSKLTNQIHKLYSINLITFLNLKFKFSENVDLLVEFLNGDLDDPVYFLIEKDYDTGVNNRRELIGEEILLASFKVPLSINELFEEAKSEYEYIDRRRFRELKITILNIVAKAAFVDFIIVTSS